MLEDRIEFTDYEEPKPVTYVEGHGHVFPRTDGIIARCGGPSLCKKCAIDLAKKIKQKDK